MPVLAESWEANADESVWTFRLRDGVTFQDGTPLDAPAARASFERLFDAGARALDGAWAIPRRTRPRSPLQIGAHSSSIWAGRSRSFRRRWPPHFGTAIVNTAALQDARGRWRLGARVGADQQRGAGHRARTASSSSTSRPGPSWSGTTGYWRGWEGEHFDEVILRVVVEPETRRALIENGEADIAATLPLATVSELEQHPDLAVDHRYSLVVRYIAMTVAGPLQSPEARQALCAGPSPTTRSSPGSTRASPSGPSARSPSCAAASTRTRSSIRLTWQRARALLAAGGGGGGNAR